MKLIEVILDDENLNEAVRRVKSNKGVAGVDKMTVYEIDTYFQNNKERIKKEILEKKYRPQPVKRVYIYSICLLFYFAVLYFLMYLISGLH